jgi:hypothetical protein
MTWKIFHGFLTFTFVVHLLAFAVIHLRSRKRTHLLLCGTFVSLTALFALKYQELDWPLGLITVQIALRAFAGAFTLLALYLSWKKIRKDAHEESPILSPKERRDRRRRRRLRGGRFRDDPDDEP